MIFALPVRRVLFMSVIKVSPIIVSIMPLLLLMFLCQSSTKLGTSFQKALSQEVPAKF